MKKQTWTVIQVGTEGRSSLDFTFPWNLSFPSEAAALAEIEKTLKEQWDEDITEDDDEEQPDKFLAEVKGERGSCKNGAAWTVYWAEFSQENFFLTCAIMQED